MRIRLENKKQKLNELEPITMLMLGSLLLNVLQFLFPRLGAIFSNAGRQLETGVRQTEEGVRELQIDPKEKESLLKKLAAAKKDLENTLKAIKENPQDIKRVERPSAIISQKVVVLLNIISEVRKKYAQELAQNKEANKKINTSLKLISGIAKTISKLDLISAISSKEDPAGLWKQVPLLQKAFRNDRKWLNLAMAIANTTEDQLKFKTTKIPKVAEGMNVFKLSGDKFVISEGYGSVIEADLARIGQLGGLSTDVGDTQSDEDRFAAAKDVTPPKQTPTPNSTATQATSARPGSAADLLMKAGIKNVSKVLQAITAWGTKNGVRFNKDKLGTVPKITATQPANPVA